MSEQMSLNEAMYNCRAMRRLQSREVPEADLIQLIDAANQAPSGSNSQNARWVVVRDASQKRKLADLNRKHAEPYIAPQRANPPNEKHKRLVDAVVWQMDHMHEIPCVNSGLLRLSRKGRGVWVFIEARVRSGRVSKTCTTHSAAH